MHRENSSEIEKKNNEIFIRNSTLNMSDAVFYCTAIRLFEVLADGLILSDYILSKTCLLLYTSFQIYTNYGVTYYVKIQIFKI